MFSSLLTLQRSSYFSFLSLKYFSSFPSSPSSSSSKHNWNCKEYQKEFIINLIKDYNCFNNPKEWPNIITRNILYKNGGATLFSKYNGIRNLFTSLFPNIEFNFKSKPRNYWFNINNQREFMLKYMKDNNMKSYDDWYNVNVLEFKNNGGGSILNKYKNFYMALITIFPDYKWDITKRKQHPKKHWENKENIQNTIRKELYELGITNKKHLNTINISQLKKLNLIYKYYNSVIDAFNDCFPECNDDITLKNLPKKHYSNINEQRLFFDKLGKQLNLSCLDDWNKIPLSIVIENKGSWILKRYRTFYDALKTIYPEHNWNERKRFRLPRNYWDSKDNVEKFLNSVIEYYKIKNMEDWYRISIIQIRKLGGTGLIIKYKNIYELLKIFYPNYNWDKSKILYRQKRSEQRWLFIQIQKIFNNYEVIEDYIYNIERNSGIALEYDIYIPLLNLAFEYQGEHHYKEIPSFGSQELYMQRDKEKQELSKQNNITLIEIPYSWDKSIESLQELLYSYNIKIPKE